MPNLFISFHDREFYIESDWNCIECSLKYFEQYIFILAL